ncbi:F-box domain-containing protein [Meloidogyne graminicola]|uniref:F-box domain-containing protein n=1 Tax=Meloidogyne graminicola TaxID=189291 RepID=A0A8S9ZEE9_9BILA|nr:F-box domain-containing protein [Meloidogyne graminicola]
MIQFSLISLLPIETIEDIFKFVPYKSLCFNVRPTNYLFLQLASKLIDKVYPRDLSLWIKDGTQIESCIISKPPLLNAKPGQLYTFKFPRSLPKSSPPASINFTHIRNDGRITDKFIIFLESIRSSIKSFVLEIISLGKFNKNLKSAWISLDALFLKLPSRCLQISVVCIDAFLSDQFFFSPFVACCPSLYIRNAIQGFDSIALSNWILNLTIRRELEFDFFSIDSKGKEDFIKNIYMLLSTLKDEATKNCNFAASFIIKVHNMGEFPISEFEVPGKIDYHYSSLSYNILQIVAGDFREMESGAKYEESDEENFITNITFA